LPKRLRPLLPAGLLVQQILPCPDHIIIATSRSQLSACCPECGVLSLRVHSQYSRTLGDLPWQGRAVRCMFKRAGSAASIRPVLAKPLLNVSRASRSARRTGRLGDLQRCLGLALGGAAGARLAERLAMPVSADTLLRGVSTASGPDTTPVPRVLAADDWAELAKVPTA